MFEELLQFGFSWTKIAQVLGVSRWTIYRRVTKYNLESMPGFHHFKDEELDEIVQGFITNNGRTLGQDYLAGYIKSLGCRIQRRRIRESMARVGLQNTALRWS